MTISVLAAISSFKEQAPEATGCATGDRVHRRHRGHAVTQGKGGHWGHSQKWVRSVKSFEQVLKNV